MKEEQDIRMLETLIIAKAVLLDKTSPKEVSQYNDLVKTYTDLIRPDERETTNPGDAIKSMEQGFSKISESFLKKEIKIERPTSIDTESPMEIKNFFENLKYSGKELKV